MFPDSEFEDKNWIIGSEYNVGVFCDQFFLTFSFRFVCFVVAMCDLVHDVETIFHLL